MSDYIKRLWYYHRRFLSLYFLIFMGVYGINLLHLPTPLSLILKPLGLRSWSAGLTRASLQLLQGNLAGAWHYNPLIFPLVCFMVGYVFVSPVLPKARKAYDRKVTQQ